MVIICIRMKNKEIFKTKSQVAKELGICVKTLNKYLRIEGVHINKGLIDPRKYMEIRTKLGIVTDLGKTQ